MNKNPQTDPAGKPMRKLGAVCGRAQKGAMQKSVWRAFLLGVLLEEGGSISWASAPKEATVRIPDATRLNLTLKACNYTFRYIDGVSVNGQGGNLYLSGPTSGSGRVCCVSYVYGAAALEVTVRWQSGACMYRNPGASGDGTDRLYMVFTVK